MNLRHVWKSRSHAYWIFVPSCSSFITFLSHTVSMGTGCFNTYRRVFCTLGWFTIRNNLVTWPYDCISWIYNSSHCVLCSFSNKSDDAHLFKLQNISWYGIIYFQMKLHAFKLIWVIVKPTWSPTVLSPWGKKKKKENGESGFVRFLLWDFFFFSLFVAFAKAWWLWD